ncbi:MAG TPA: mechanosensitive ion channel domain-containing protein [Dermatophilaceae bacterium]|nr:mechanosensitive ion channel domain-containing protein [Dermatophilaceae bacterium]
MIRVSMNVPTLNLADVSDALAGLMVPLLISAAAVVAALLLSALLRAGLRVAARRWPTMLRLSVRIKWPLRLLLASIAVWLAVVFTTEEASWTAPAEQTLRIMVIVAGAWLLVQVTHVLQDAIVARFPTDMADNRHARQIHTQVQMLDRLVTALIVVVAAAAILYTFPAMRAIGVSILASAGLAAIIAGLAAQSTLANVFAGMQIAFSDSFRVDDVVVVEDEWGVIEEITLTYVVVRVWDDRCLILPSTYFTSTPFQNWTRRSSQLLGTVELDVDWTVPMDGLRTEMQRLLSQTDLWDQRVSGIQVTEATGGLIRVRALASAVSAPILWDLRCYLREGLITWLQETESGLPRTRVAALEGENIADIAIRRESSTGRAARPNPTTGPGGDVPLSGHDTGLFTGTNEAVQRSKPFSGPAQEVLDEREKAAPRATRPPEASDQQDRSGFEDRV